MTHDNRGARPGILAPLDPQSNKIRFLEICETDSSRQERPRPRMVRKNIRDAQPFYTLTYDPDVAYHPEAERFGVSCGGAILRCRGDHLEDVIKAITDRFGHIESRVLRIWDERLCGSHEDPWEVKAWAKAEALKSAECVFAWLGRGTTESDKWFSGVDELQRTRGRATNTFVDVRSDIHPGIHDNVVDVAGRSYWKR